MKDYYLKHINSFLNNETNAEDSNLTKDESSVLTMLLIAYEREDVELIRAVYKRINILGLYKSNDELHVFTFGREHKFDSHYESCLKYYLEDKEQFASSLQGRNILTLFADHPNAEFAVHAVSLLFRSGFEPNVDSRGNSPSEILKKRELGADILQISLERQEQAYAATYAFNRMIGNIESKLRSLHVSTPAIGKCIEIIMNDKLSSDQSQSR